MKFPILIANVFLFFLLGSINGQDNLLPGKIITHDGDTINGQINYHDWASSPKSIEFVHSSGQVSILQAFEIRSFIVSGRKYTSGAMEINRSANESKSISQNPSDLTVQDTAFVEVLVEGSKSLCYYVDDQFEEYFLAAYDDKFVWLIYKEVLKDEEHGGQVHSVTFEDARFRGQLSFLFSDCPKMHSRIQNSSYRKPKLKQLFKSYMACTDQEIRFEEKDKYENLELRVLAGLNYSSLKQDQYDNEGNYIFANSDFKNTLNPYFGLSLNYILPFHQEKLSLTSELSWNHYKTSAGSTSELEDYFSFHQGYELSKSGLGLALMLDYSFFLKGSHFFIGGGGSFEHVYKQDTKHKFVPYNAFPSNSSIVNGAIGEGCFNLVNFGYIMNIGYKSGRFSVEARYTTNKDFMAVQGVDTQLNSFGVIAGYSF